jgi:hypothetical protein
MRIELMGKPASTDDPQVLAAADAHPPQSGNYRDQPLAT